MHRHAPIYRPFDTAGCPVTRPLPQLRVRSSFASLSELRAPHSAWTPFSPSLSISIYISLVRWLSLYVFVSIRRVCSSLQPRTTIPFPNSDHHLICLSALLQICVESRVTLTVGVRFHQGGRSIRFR